jgi:hypothetical protein
MEQNNNTPQQIPQFSNEELNAAKESIDMIVFKFRPACKIHADNVMGNTYQAVYYHLQLQEAFINSLYNDGHISLATKIVLQNQFLPLMREALKIYAQENNY